MSDLPTPIPAELARLRGSIDNIDAALVYLLAERFKATQQVGVLKATAGLPPSDPGREERAGRPAAGARAPADLDPVFAEKFLAFIVEEVIRHHEEIAQGHARRTDASRGGAPSAEGRKVGGVSSGGPRGAERACGRRGSSIPEVLPMDLHWLKPLLGRPSPFTTVYLDATRAGGGR